MARRMSKAAARKRLHEAEAKVLNVMLAGHIGAKAGTDLALKLKNLAKRIQ